MEGELTVGQLWDGIDGGSIIGGLDTGPLHPKYRVVAVLNPDEGPDEQILTVTGAVWDHQMGYLRLECE